MELKITASNFENEVLHSDKPVLVDFYADWCGPCKMMAPLVEKMAVSYEGRVKIGKCNIDDNMDLSQKYRVTSIPTFILFRDGKAEETSVGAKTERELKAMLERVLA